MAKDISDPKAVIAFIQKLEPTFAKLVEATRQLILSTDKQIGEQIKWNSPCFFYPGDMKAFDAKEYKRDLLVIHTRRNMALLIFPTGASINDSTGILEGDYTDGRRMITFKTLDDLKVKGKDMQKVIRLWLDALE